MLIVAGSFVTKPGRRADFLAAVRPMVVATHTEAGCQEYVFSADPDDENRVVLYELWDSQEALEGHFASDHMAAWQATSKELDAVESGDIKKYTISDVGPVR